MSDTATFVLIGLATGYLAITVESVYLHRGLTHGGLEFSRGGHLLFRTATWLLIGTTPQKWVAVHRKHHRFSDTDKDPHSPHNFRRFGVGHILLASAVYYTRAVSTPDELRRYARDVAPDRLDRLVFSHGLAGLGVFYGSLGVLFGWVPGALIFACHAGFYYVVQGFLNGVCHWSFNGQRAVVTVNRRFFALLTMGESLHDNHHEIPRCPALSRAPRELDPGWVVTRALLALGLARVSRGGERALRRAEAVRTARRSPLIPAPT